MTFRLLTLFGLLTTALLAEKPSILILTGEPEYGSRQTLGTLGKQLNEAYGAQITHIHVEKKGEQHHFPGLKAALKNTDLLIHYLRFLNLTETDYQLLDDYHAGSGSFIAVRTSTHPFRFERDSKLFNQARDFPTRHFGTPYRGHHGHDTSQVNYVMAARHPVMTGVEPRFWTPDFVYATNPLSVHCTPLMVGQGLKGLQPATFKEANPVNHVYVLSEKDETRVIGTPHPVVWTVEDPNTEERSLVSTVGARKSFDDPNVRRLFHNAVLWCLEMEDQIPKEAP
ncbi:MAG: hypothetical protein AAGI48_06825 [Verrucomicrobiota bacterium]